MDRQPPSTTSDEIDLYIRTYYSLLRSSGDVHVRAFEEAHAWSDSSLHSGARDTRPDVAAFAYSAARLPDCAPSLERVVLGQSELQFEGEGLEVSRWQPVATRGRRRALRWDGQSVLAAFVGSVSDIDDLVPILTAYQIEWNKMHARLSESSHGRALAANSSTELDREALADVLQVSMGDVATLERAFGETFERDVQQMAQRTMNLRVRLINGSFVEYQRAAQRWWKGIEPAYSTSDRIRGRPVYFVSSNTHAINNLLGGYALAHQEGIFQYARTCNPEGLAAELDRVEKTGRPGELANLSYYLLRRYLHDSDEAEARMAEVQAFDRESGIVTIEAPGRIDVAAQVVEVRSLQPERFDSRVTMPGFERLKDSDAVIINIDYPLGMSAYHHLSRLTQGVGEIRGIYVMGKAATLNGRVGDVMLSNVAYDEHSKNTYLFKNCFQASEIQAHAMRATVLDSQKALTVRGSFLQNREYMGVFYSEGYTVLEMEAGPYLSALYEIVRPTRHPQDEIVHLSTILPFDFGLIHYASDTPYSRRQSLLSKSLSYFGMDSTYASAIAIVRRILSAELDRLR